MCLRVPVVLLVMTVLSAAPAADREADDLQRALTEDLARAEDALVADGDDLSALQSRGDALFFLGRFDEAVRDYDRMLELQPLLGPKHWQRGLALHFAGRYDDSAKQFERYYELDKSDRENGIWRFYAQVKQHGVDDARKSLLPYRQPDREPLPIIYRMCEGTATPQQVLESVNAANVTGSEQQKRRFYADLYVGLDAAIVRDDRHAARPCFERAIANDWPRDAGYGPAFMWHVARLSLAALPTR